MQEKKYQGATKHSTFVMSVDQVKHVVMESRSLRISDAFNNEQNVKKCRFTALLTGTTDDYMRGTPCMQISPKLFGKDASKRLIVKHLKLEFVKNSAPFAVNLTMTQNGESSAYMNSQYKEGSNPDNSSLLTVPFHSKMDCVRDPVSLVSFDKLTKDDYEMVLKYESGHDIGNISVDGIFPTELKIRDPKTLTEQKVFYVMQSHPVITELSRSSEEIRLTFEFQKREGLVDGKYRIGEIALNFGLQLVTSRLKRCPTLDVCCMKLHAACAYPEVYRPIMERSENQNEANVHQVFAVLTLEYVAF